MGLDFLRNKARSFRKSWSGGVARLAEPSLFTRYPECHSRSVIASLAQDAAVEVGAPLALHVDGKLLAVVRETTRVGTVSEPPADLLSAITKAGGGASGRISQVNPISGTANVEIE
jgi:hypothetical protein